MTWQEPLTHLFTLWRRSQITFAPKLLSLTEPSAEFDISRPDGSWLELGGCGMVHPNVLRNCNIDPKVWQGFAFGFGIDRLVNEIPT